MERKVLQVPVALLVLLVLGEIQVVLALLDPLVLLVFLARRESASEEAKEKMDFQEDKDQEVITAEPPEKHLTTRSG